MEKIKRLYQDLDWTNAILGLMELLEDRGYDLTEEKAGLEAIKDEIIHDLVNTVEVTLHCKSCGHEWEVLADVVHDETIIQDDQTMNCPECGDEGDWKQD